MESDAHKTPPPQPFTQAINAPPPPQTEKEAQAPDTLEEDSLTKAVEIAGKHGIPSRINPTELVPISVIPPEAEVDITIEDKPTTGDKVKDEIQKLLVLEAKKNESRRSKRKARGEVTFKVTPKDSPEVPKERPRRIKMVAPRPIGKSAPPKPSKEEQKVLAEIFKKKKEDFAKAMKEAEEEKKRAEKEAATKAKKEAVETKKRAHKEAAEEKKKAQKEAAEKKEGRKRG